MPMSKRKKRQQKQIRKMACANSMDNSSEKEKIMNVYVEHKYQQSLYDKDPTSGDEAVKSRLPNVNGTDGSEEMLVLALYDYKAMYYNELNLKRGEKLRILEKSGDWWYAKSVMTGTQGFIPRNYVEKAETVENEDWFFKVSRKEAERLLLSPVNSRGSFLIRDCETIKGNYTLSFRDYDQQKGNQVKHYMIHHQIDWRKFYISPRITFDTLQELVKYYQKHSAGLSCQLNVPCRLAEPQKLSENDAREIPREYLQVHNKPGAQQFGEEWMNAVIQDKGPLEKQPTVFTARPSVDVQPATDAMNKTDMKNPDAPKPPLTQEHSLAHILGRVESHLFDIATSMSQICSAFQQLGPTLTILLSEPHRCTVPMGIDASVQVGHTEPTHPGDKFQDASENELRSAQYASPVKRLQ